MGWSLPLTLATDRKCTRTDFSQASYIREDVCCKSHIRVHIILLPYLVHLKRPPGPVSRLHYGAVGTLFYWTGLYGQFLDVCCKKQIPTQCSSGTESISHSRNPTAFMEPTGKALRSSGLSHSVSGFSLHTPTDGVRYNKRTEFLTSPRQELVNSHNPNVRYRTHRSSTRGPILKQMNPISTTTLFLQDQFLILSSYIHLLFQRVSSFKFSQQIFCVHFWYP
jgi:hypothetical protein